MLSSTHTFQHRSQFLPLGEIYHYMIRKVMNDQEELGAVCPCFLGVVSLVFLFLDLLSYLLCMDIVDRWMCYMWSEFFQD